MLYHAHLVVMLIQLVRHNVLNARRDRTLIIVAQVVVNYVLPALSVPIS